MIRACLFSFVGLMAIAPGPARAGPLPIKLTELATCQGPGTICDRFYPIGFSKDGKFAYVELPADEAVGGFLWTFKIVDLVTDKTVDTVGWDQSGAGLDEIQNLKTLLKKKRRGFEVLLGKHKIRPVANPRLKVFPMKIGQREIHANLEDEVPASPDAEPGYKSVIHHVVLADSSGRAKEIGKLTSAEGDMGFFTAPPKIKGYLKSPFGPRAVVVLRQTRRGYEGPPHVSSFVLLGAHLKVGFKKSYQHHGAK